MTEQNGSHVSRAELQAHLDPMRANIWEIKADVKTLLMNAAARDGEAKKGRRLSDRLLAFGALTVSALAAAAALLHL